MTSGEAIMILRVLFINLLIIATCVLEAKPPELTNKETKRKIEEILKAHVSYKTLNHEILKRSLVNFFDELDSTKTYFIENEIVKWIDPSEQTLNQMQQDFQNESFSQYEKIYDIMISAIKRRSDLEKKTAHSPLAEKVSVTEFKDLTWAKSPNELKDRIIQLRSLQLEAAETLNDEEIQEQFLQKIAKRRTNRESEINAGNKKDRHKQMLSFVLKSLTASLDAHTSYFTPAEANQFMIQVQQRLFGIGAQLRDDLNGFTIVRLLDGGPALLSNKIKTGDRIIAVNDEAVVGLDIIEAVDLIRGPRGSKIHLTLLREHQEEDGEKHQEKVSVDIVRDEIVLKETRFETNLEPYGEGVIAHIHLFSFYQDPNSSSTKDIKEAIEKIQKENKLLGVILDLRNNAGGILPQAVSVTGLFISKGIVASIKDSAGKVQHLRNFDGSITYNGPLFVLTNRASASAAEIVAQALQDYGRAIIIGDTHTYGKGSYQSFTLESTNLNKINPQGEYKVTRGIYYTVSGKSPQLHGAKADIVVPGILSELDIGESFAKFPLDPDQISENFDDDLTDVHPLHRGKMKRLYKNNLQPKLAFYDAYLPNLMENSEKRLAANSNFQNFLTEIKKSEPSIETMESFGQNDIQLEEAYAIMKDMIFLTNESEAYQETEAVSAR
ncbi:MAG: hypothetical protein S4CHLAM37_05500 [Chlamydiia bacterium]|nr:hypothetical protein [Chlamydiia bacterium]